MSSSQEGKASDGSGFSLLFVIMAACTLMSLAYVASRIFLQLQIERKIKSLARQGYATTVDDLRRMYSCPENDPNQADLYERAFPRIKPVSAGDEKLVPVMGLGRLPEGGKPLPEAMRKAVQRHLARNSSGSRACGSPGRRWRSSGSVLKPAACQPTSVICSRPTSRRGQTTRLIEPFCATVPDRAGTRSTASALTEMTTAGPPQIRRT
jgi:hypothetical protein